MDRASPGLLCHLDVRFLPDNMALFLLAVPRPMPRTVGPSPFLQVCQSITVISASATFELWTRSIGIDRKSDLPYGEMFPSDEYF